MRHVLVDLEIYEEIKKINLAKGVNQFKMDDFDQCVLFYDIDMKLIDPERLKIENIEISKVLLPRFLLIENMDKLEDFRYTDDKGNQITYLDLIKDEEENIKKYGLKDEQEKIINEILKNKNHQSS